MEKKTARLIKGVGGLYTARTDEGETVLCRAKGSFRKEGMRPLPGDFVTVSPQKEGDALITEILPRKNALIRPAGANIDRMIFVIAAAKPDPDLYLIDKMTAVLRHNNIETFLLINKADVAPEKARYLREIYEKAGFKAAVFSAHRAEEYETTSVVLHEEMRHSVSFFTGASGVGKSSVIAELYPEFAEEMKTGTLSEKIERGKHTTRKTELFPIGEDGYIADTPGFSMLEIARFNLIPKDGLLGAFPDIEHFSTHCRYSDCTHTQEEGCGVLEAVREGKIAPSRQESFRKLFDELKQTNEWEK